MNVHHPKVKKILRQCERRIMKLTGQGPVSIFVLNTPGVVIPYEVIEKIVCEVTGIEIERITLPTRIIEYRIARQLICFYARQYTHMPYRLIGQKVHRYDHTTVINSIQRIKWLIETGDTEVCRLVKDINMRIEQAKKLDIN